MTKRPLLLGHRGARASRSVEENTIASFELAMAHGCDGFEFDLRRSGDGAAVICHDPVWRASTEGGKPGIEIAGATVAELGGIATLRDVLERFAGGTYLDIELKVGGLEKDVVAAIEAHSPRCGFVVSSFLPEVLISVHAISAKMPLGLICDTPKQMAQWETLEVSAVIPQHKLVTRELVGILKASQKQVLVWTVNDAGRMRELAEWGVDGLISDDTKLLAKTFAGLAPHSAHER